MQFQTACYIFIIMDHCLISGLKLGWESVTMLNRTFENMGVHGGVVAGRKKVNHKRVYGGENTGTQWLLGRYL